MKWLRRIAVAAIVLVALGYAGAAGYMYVNQRSFQYDTTGEFIDLGQTALAGAQIVEIPTTGGETIRGWYEAPGTAGKPVIVYYRGNAGSFAREHERYEAFVADGYGFVAFDYRGFPASPGVLNETNVLADGLAAFDWVAQKGFPLVIWGRSLGSGPATYVASQREAKALLLETPFDSAVAVAKDRYGFLPVEWIMHDQYRVDQWIADVTEPVFVAHGTADTTIGYAHGVRVDQLAINKVPMWTVEGAGHSNLWEAGLWPRAKAFFDEAMAE